jgi:hypothetical protein
MCRAFSPQAKAHERWGVSLSHSRLAQSPYWRADNAHCSGSLPAPENGALQVHNDVSPILAQTYTQAFDVYSAKRFPGVPGK